jgi:hypothetical protein
VCLNLTISWEVYVERDFLRILLSSAETMQFIKVRMYFYSLPYLIMLLKIAFHTIYLLIYSLCNNTMSKNRDSVVSIATSYGLDDRGARV